MEYDTSQPPDPDKDGENEILRHSSEYRSSEVPPLQPSDTDPYLEEDEEDALESARKEVEAAQAAEQADDEAHGDK